MAYESTSGVWINQTIEEWIPVLGDFDALGPPSSDGEFIVATGAGTFTYESGNTARTSLGLGTGDNPTFTGGTYTGSLDVEGTISGSTSISTTDLTVIDEVDVEGSVLVDANGTLIDQGVGTLNAEGIYINDTEITTLLSASEHDHVAAEITDFVSVGDTNWAETEHDHVAAEITDLSLADNSDVTITSVTDREMLAYESGAAEWINQTIEEWIPILGDFDTLGAAASDGQFIVAAGAGAFTYESGNTARTSLGLGTGDSPAFTGVTATGAGDIEGAATLGSTVDVEGIATFSSNPIIEGTAPSLEFSDTTASAHDFRVLVDASAWNLDVDIAGAETFATEVLAIDVDEVRVAVAADIEGFLIAASGLTTTNVTSSGVGDVEGVWTFNGAPVFATTTDFEGVSTFNAATHVIVGNMTVEGSLVSFAEATDEHVLTFNAGTETWEPQAGGGGGGALSDLSDVTTEIMGAAQDEYLLTWNDSAEVWEDQVNPGELPESCNNILAGRIFG